MLKSVLKSIRLKEEDVGTLLRKHRIDLDALEDPRATIPLSEFVSVFEALAKALADPYLGLRLGRKVDQDIFGGIGYLFMSAKTLGAAFSAWSQYIGMVQNVSVSRTRIEGDKYIFEYQILDDLIWPRRQDTEFSISHITSLADRYSKGRCKPREVHFEHQIEGAHANYIDLLGVQTYFEQPTNAVIFSRSDIDCEFDTYDGRLFETMQTLLKRVDVEYDEPDTWTQRVKSRLNEQQFTQNLCASKVAASLGFSKATLYRKLKFEGTNYKSVLQSRRTDIALRLLRERELSIAEIGLRLGYVEHSVFTRAFKLWTGSTPSQWRRSYFAGQLSKSRQSPDPKNHSL